MPPTAPNPQSTRAREIGHNLKRLLARHNLTLLAATELTGVDDRTIRGILRGNSRAQNKTYHKLATGLGVGVDELFKRSGDPRYQFDRATNPAVTAFVDAHPALFKGWEQEDFEELLSIRGVGGELTEEGVEMAVEHINHRRALQTKLAVLLQTQAAPYIEDFIEAAYRRETSFQSPRSWR